MMRCRIQWTLVCTLMMLTSGCVHRSVARPALDSKHPALDSSLVSGSVRGVYKVSSEGGKQAEERAALLLRAPDLAPALELAELNPQDKEARSLIVSEYLSRNFYWGAYELLTNALAIDSNDPAVNLGLAMIWDAWGQYNLAWQYGERAVAHGAASPQAYETLGRIRLHQNEPAEAIVWYSRSLEYVRTSPVLSNMGYAQMLASDWDNARTSLEEAVQLDDTLEEAHNNLAVVLSRIGDDTGALAHLLKTGRPAAAFNNLAVLYQKEKRPYDAQHYFEEALRLEPAYEIARRNLDALQESLPPPSIVHLPAVISEPKDSPIVADLPFDGLDEGWTESPVPAARAAPVDAEEKRMAVSRAAENGDTPDAITRPIEVATEFSQKTFGFQAFPSSFGSNKRCRAGTGYGSFRPTCKDESTADVKKK